MIKNVLYACTKISIKKYIIPIKVTVTELTAMDCIEETRGEKPQSSQGMDKTIEAKEETVKTLKMLMAWWLLPWSLVPNSVLKSKNSWNDP